MVRVKHRRVERRRSWRQRGMILGEEAGMRTDQKGELVMREAQLLQRSSLRSNCLAQRTSQRSECAAATIAPPCANPPAHSLFIRVCSSVPFILFNPSSDDVGVRPITSGLYKCCIYNS